MHHSTLQVLIDLTQEYLMLLAKKTMREAESCSRTKPCILDVIGTLDYVQVLPKDLSDYIAAVTAKKEKTRAPFTFPRPEPAHFPTSE
jgi:hypothetical protein